METSKLLRDVDWQSIYESQPSEDSAYLVEEFFVPALERSTRYNRIAGYFDSGSLAVAANGIEALVENDGEMRLIAGAQFQPKDRPVLEALADNLEDSLTELDDDTLDARLQLLAWLLREHRLDIKIAVPSHRDWGIFHPKLGIFYDENDDILSFEGSINETASGWTRNYERFKVHRSWVDGQQSYVEGDCASFERLWNNEHEYVDVYDLPEALREKLINWKAPDTDVDVDTIVERIRGPTGPTTADKAMILADGAQAPGGLQLAEEASTVEPWPHQRVVSDTAVNTYPNSFLFCDEVGLGKTIETGLTLSRLGLTGELESGLVLAPASLVVQWQEELWEKFNINTYRYERGSNYEYTFIDTFGVEHQAPGTADLDINADRHDEAWTSSPIWRFVHQRANDPWPTIIVMSWHTARLSDRWEQVAPADNGPPRRRSDIPAGCRGRTSDHREGVWDAVVIDEAHNARRGSSFYNLLKRLREHTHCYYLLTATPMQLHHRELYDLLTLLDLPDTWDNRDSFVEFFETRQALASVLDGGADISNRSGSDQTLQATLGETYQHRSDQSVEYADIVLEGIVSELELEDEGRGVAKQRLLQACNLVRGYGERYDDYRRKVDDAIDEGIDPFAADEDTKLKRLLYPTSVAEEEMLIVSRMDRLNALDELSEEGWQVLQDVFTWATPVDACIHRNTRDTLRKYRKVGLLDATIPTRKPKRRRIELNDETRRIYDRIDDYTRTFYKKAQQSSESDARAIGFVMTTYRQRLTSSIYAISQSLSSRIETLRQQRTLLKRRQHVHNQEDDQQAVLDSLTDFDEEEFAELEDAGENLFNVDLTELAPSLTDEGIELLEEEIEELESFIQEVKQIDEDPKMGQLFDDLRMLDKKGRNRIIVFTQYKDTMHFVRDRLRWKFGENIACYSGDGGEMYVEDADTWRNVGKERVKREFAESDGDIDVLVCTNSASEGLNLQECGALINYDMPWNPMRVEQRIGRIDRIGQKYDEIIILNYSYEDTVESDIYDRLDDRIGLFEYVVGDMQPILSSVGQQIRAATLEEGVKSGTEEYERLQADIESDIDEQEAEDDPVELQESLADVDTGTPLREQVIEEARLDAWETYSHPDLGAVGDSTTARDPVFSVAAAEAVFVDSDGFADTDIEFTRLDMLEQEFDLVNPDHREAIYRVTLPHDSDEWTTPDEGTLGAAIVHDNNTAAVTFSPECADAYPSVRFLAPGSPLFAWLIEQFVETSDELTLTQKACGDPADSDHGCHEREHRPWTVCGWTFGEEFVTMLSSEGALETSDVESVIDELDTWCTAFAQLRDRSSA
jgi:superfamily II DNA or RNA helicase